MGKNEEELDTFIEQHEYLSWQKGPNFHQTEKEIRELINLNNS